MENRVSNTIYPILILKEKDFLPNCVQTGADSSSI